MRSTATAHAQALMERFGLSYTHLLGLRFAINVALGTTIVWIVLQSIGDPHPIWAIASMIAASDPEPQEARRMFRCRLANVMVGSAAGLLFLLSGVTHPWILPIALAATVLICTYVIRIETM